MNDQELINELDVLQLPATLTGFSSKVDLSASIRFNTQELDTVDFVTMRNFQGAFGYLCFKKNQFDTKDLPKEQAEEGNKTSSQRLRAVIYVRWQQTGSKGDFEVYYREIMNNIIEKLKAKLDN